MPEAGCPGGIGSGTNFKPQGRYQGAVWCILVGDCQSRSATHRSIEDHDPACDSTSRFIRDDRKNEDRKRIESRDDCISLFLEASEEGRARGKRGSPRHFPSLRIRYRDKLRYQLIFSRKVRSLTLATKRHVTRAKDARNDYARLNSSSRVRLKKVR